MAYTIADNSDSSGTLTTSIFAFWQGSRCELEDVSGFLKAFGRLSCACTIDNPKCSDQKPETLNPKPNE